MNKYNDEQFFKKKMASFL